MKKLLSITSALLFLLTAVSCDDKSALQFKENEKLSVITTNFALYDFAREIGGDYADVTLLIKPGTEIHSYEPTAADMVKINECDVFLYIGGESEGWIESVIETVDTQSVEIVRLFDSVESLEEQQDEHDHDHDEDEHIYDEHIWTSPKNAVLMCESIRQAFCLKDSEHQSAYNDAFSQYSDELNALDAEFRSIVNDSERQVIAVGDRFPFLYFVHEYGLDYCSAFTGCSTDSDVSIETMTQMTELIKSECIPVVFYIEMSNMQIANTLCEETGAKPMLLHSCQNVTADEMNSGATYLTLMQQNAENLREALN